MIKSDLKTISQLKKILENPKQILKDLDKLTAQEKKTLAALKKLHEGQSYSKYKKDIEDAGKTAQAELQDKKLEATQVINAAKKEAAEIKSQAADDAAYAKQMQCIATASKDCAIEAEKVLQIKSTKIEGLLSRAQEEKDKYEALRKSYDAKLTDLKSRFQGLN